MTSDEKIEIIAFIVDRQAAEQNDEDGDKHLSDPYLALEAIECVLDGDPGTSRGLGNGALRTFLEARS